MIPLIGVLGCQSASQYVSPRVEGRVVDAQTHEPIKDVRVRRLTSEQGNGLDNQRKAGVANDKSVGVRTSADGRFVLSSEKDLAILRQATWFSVTVSFQYPAYQGTIMNYTMFNATNNPDGEPVIRTGDVLLHAETQ